jgi:hypothetical protein
MVLSQQGEHIFQIYKWLLRTKAHLTVQASLYVVGRVMSHKFQDNAFVYGVAGVVRVHVTPAGKASYLTLKMIALMALSCTHCRSVSTWLLRIYLYKYLLTPTLAFLGPFNLQAISE